MTGTIIAADKEVPGGLATGAPSQFVVTSSFAYGLLVGQLSVLVVLGIFIRFFIFADPHPSSTIQRKDKRGPTKVLPSTPASVNTILEKTYYNVDTHPAESLDWFTVLLAQVISQFREDARANDNILKSLTNLLNGNKTPDFVDTIKVTELNIGDDYPIFSNCKIFQNEHEEETGGLEAQIDVDLTDVITLGIDTRLLLNFPRSLFAFLPISLSVSIVRFSGRLTVSLRKLKSDDGSGKTYLTFSFAPDYRLEFSVKSLVGARSKLQDVPKIGQVIESRLRKWFTDRCVAPRYQQIPLPSFWPRSKFTKEHSQVQPPNSPHLHPSLSSELNRTPSQTAGIHRSPSQSAANAIPGSFRPSSTLSVENEGLRRRASIAVDD
ncbi:hypothetical protein TRICI_003261 [Trichomonascus ciferrii]|uniref:Maintenance of mitochondrial morphology protein 1 n=1 Tax=Trichomonascus ciferrii TaxID=44093 RepID=A0A642V4A9_9ASCO|nr:hypothetical protein TRICI_003261 [Trichomonascus ciferrii]